MYESVVFCSACTMSSVKNFTFAISSPDEFLVNESHQITMVTNGQYCRICIMSTHSSLTADRAVDVDCDDRGSPMTSSRYVIMHQLDLAAVVSIRMLDWTQCP